MNMGPSIARQIAGLGQAAGNAATQVVPACYLFGEGFQGQLDPFGHLRAKPLGNWLQIIAAIAVRVCNKA